MSAISSTVVAPMRAPAALTEGVDRFSIPARTNLAIAGMQLLVLIAVLTATASVTSWWGVLFLAMVYGLAMNSAYAMLHEAEHGIAHPHPVVNTTIGVVLALFFPAPFHLLRQGHLGHHQRNRSDDEAFDLYFAGENAVWKHMQLYGILTGLFWVVILFSNFIALLAPRLLRSDGAKATSFDRPTEALVETLNPRYVPWIRLEALAAIALHAAIIIGLDVPIHRYLIVLYGFGLTWSTVQYAHHFGTERHVTRGALDLRSLPVVDRLLLNHNWHRRHHRHPTVPWIHLPRIEEGVAAPRGSFLVACLTQWRGPRRTDVHVENRYAGRIIR